MDLLNKKQMGEFMPGFAYSKPRTAKTYKEADLHLSFCKWLKKEYPELSFVRHEKEGKRSKYMQSLILQYNSIDGIADFELIERVEPYNGLYIEFKKPGEKWVQRDGVTVKKDYEHQYRFHMNAWDIGRCAYFCNDFLEAKCILQAYLTGRPLPKQILQLNIVDDGFELPF